MTATTSEALVLDALRASGSASVGDLSVRLGLGEATVRRALQRLAEDGRAIRTYGGAVLPDRAHAVRDAVDPRAAARRAIGAAAAGLIRDGETIALSSGSTVLELARLLRDRRLTVITNALPVANALLDAPGIELVVLGGVLLRGMNSLGGHITEAAMADLRADRLFMGASAVDMEHGFMTEQVQEIPVDRALRRMAREAVILADAAKFDRVAPGFMFGFSHVGTVVTDPAVRPETVAALEAHGIRVVLGGDPGSG
ncbi:MAG: DeoR/GlpR family DNA-binding transcription regulator [Chloroflexota bacterium]